MLRDTEPGVLASMLDPNRRTVEWTLGPFWQKDAWCAFHDHFAPDDSEKCGRCGWRGEPDLGTLIWWLSDFKRVTPHVIGRVELGGTILRGDPKHPEIPNILRAQQIRIAGPLIVAPGDGAEHHVWALAERYHVDDVRLSSAARFGPGWLQKVPADLAAPPAAKAWWHGGAPGRTPGDWLTGRLASGIFRPSDILHTLRAAGKGGEAARLAHDVRHETHLAYVTDSLATARTYARGYTMWLEAIGAPGTGCVYRVEPEGFVMPDSNDPERDDLFACRRAKVTAIEQAVVPSQCSPAEQRLVRELRACYELWRDEFNGGADRWPGHCGSADDGHGK